MVLTSSNVLHSEPTAAEIAKASSYLSETREALIASVTGLTDSQWEFKPASGGWSISEIVEHVVLVEGRIQGIVGRMSDAPPPPPDWSQSEMEKNVVPSVLDRSTKFQASPIAHPSQHWTAPEALGRFTEARAQSINLLSAPALRGHVIPHPVRGLWDGYQWVLAIGAHSARHTDQIREVKAGPGYPKSE